MVFLWHQQQRQVGRGRGRNRVGGGVQGGGGGAGGSFRVVPFFLRLFGFDPVFFHFSFFSFLSSNFQVLVYFFAVFHSYDMPFLPSKPISDSLSSPRSSQLPPLRSFPEPKLKGGGGMRGGGMGFRCEWRGRWRRCLTQSLTRTSTADPGAHSWEPLSAHRWEGETGGRPGVGGTGWVCCKGVVAFLVYDPERGRGVTGVGVGGM